MFEDRIEVLNPCMLHGTNRTEKLAAATTMEARNPTIVRILEVKGSVIENRHSGIPTMKREMKKYGLQEPEFYEERDSFKVIFRNNLVNKSQSDTQSDTQFTIVTEITDKVLKYCEEPRIAKEIREYLNIL